MFSMCDGICSTNDSYRDLGFVDVKGLLGFASAKKTNENFAKIISSPTGTQGQVSTNVDLSDVKNLIQTQTDRINELQKRLDDQNILLSSQKMELNNKVSKRDLEDNNQLLIPIIESKVAQTALRDKVDELTTKIDSKVSQREFNDNKQYLTSKLNFNFKLLNEREHIQDFTSV